MSAAAQSVAHSLLRRSSLPPLSPKKPYDGALSSQIDGLSDPLPIKAALFLCNDDITAAHEAAQSCEGDPVADHVHQQVHRRDGDYWNSKWWLGQMARGEPSKAFISTHGTVDNGKAFVDACASASRGGSSSDRERLETKQWQEIRLTVEGALGL